MVDHHLKRFLCPLVIAEIILLVTLFKAVKKKKDASATNWGKWKMALECVVILTGLATILAKKHGIMVPQYITYPMICAAATAAFLAVMSIKGHITDFCDS
jgi:phosphatidylglycerophosphate synthase